MDKQFIITRQGKEFVLYAGLLDEAHRQGLKRISTTLLQIPIDENSQVAIVTAEVETEKGTFSGIGDASPLNVSRMIVPHLLRMAETRAKARALRDAVNVGVAALEELGDADESNGHSTDSVLATEKETWTELVHEARNSPAPKSSPYKSATANQLATIIKLSRLLGQPEQPGEDLTSAAASDRITELAAEYNSRKTAPTGRKTA